jgi:hypothetical protein
MMAQMITDRGKPTEIIWQQEEKEVRRLPGLKIVAGILPVPREGGFTKVVSELLPPVPGVTDNPDLAGFYQADWFLSFDSGLTIKQVRYVQAALPDQTHNIVEFMQWQHLRLIVDRGPAPVQVMPIPFTDDACLEATLITKPGKRTSDGKTFAWAASATFKPFHLPDKSAAGVASKITYTVTITQSYLFGAPDADIEPSAHVVAVKVWPLLTVTVESSDPVGFPPPSFAADLKLVFSPRLSRPDQNRPAAQFPDPGRRNTNIVSTFCDTNNLARGIPGSGTPPLRPFWDRVFDYAEPDIGNEIEFDAVIFPRSKVSTDPYILSGPNAVQLQGLACQREPGQGEFDNVHIHPWVGFDDPSNASGTNPASPALIEAPIAADEVVHMHWRWGVGIPQGVKDSDFPGDPNAAEKLRRSFRGYDERGNQPNNQAGAPLIPTNQSLHLKIADPKHDVSRPPGGPLDPDATAIWYSPTFKFPENHGYTNFCGHGFALAYRLLPLSAPVGAETNADLLGDPTPPFFSYHTLRWDGSGKQRIPTASAASPDGLSRNRLGTGVDQPVFTFG